MGQLQVISCWCIYMINSLNKKIELSKVNQQICL